MGKPAPFKRPSIDLGRHGRSWRTADAGSLVRGDIVKDRGLVASTHKFHNTETSVDCIDVYYVNDEIDTFCIFDTVCAFVRGSSEDAGA